MFESIVAGFGVALTPFNLAVIAAGSVLGIFVGALPGLSAASGLAIILPFTSMLPPISALLTMAALYTAAEYGGSITAITIGVPGTPASFATTFDGFAMSQKGETAKALGISIIASAVGGVVGTVILVLAAAPISGFALMFGPAEYFSLAVFGLSIIGNLAGTSAIKSFIAVMLGLLAGVVGVDVLTGHPRLTFGIVGLLEGFDLIPALIGLFAISEVLRLIEQPPQVVEISDKPAGRLPTRTDIVALMPTMLRGSIIGTAVGAVPGAGTTISSLIAYSDAKRASRHPEAFGHGSPEGVAAPEAANNSAVGGAMIPLLTLGIPGSASTAVLLGGLMLHGIEPGPLLMRTQSELVYSLYGGLFVANMVVLVMAFLGIPLLVKLVSLRASTLMPIVLGISLVGTYSLGNSVFDLGVAVFFGVLGFAMRRFGFPVAPALLALVLGPILETNYRRALIISGGAHSIFVSKPLSLSLLLLALATFFVFRLRRRPKGGATISSSSAEIAGHNVRA